jgi:hypothetical protein
MKGRGKTTAGLVAAVGASVAVIGFFAGSALPGSDATGAKLPASAAKPAAARGVPLRLTSMSAINRYLRSIGIEPSSVVIQRGRRNYAGPNCPGKRWSCTNATRVVQVTTVAGANVFECSPATSETSPNSCVIVQANTDGDNDARCREKSDGPVQSCEITQTNVSGDNRATVDQDLQQSAGATQDATQTADVVQKNVSGSNRSTIDQKLKQGTKELTALGVQTQDAHQSATVCQGGSPDCFSMTTTGDNTSDIRQSLWQDAYAKSGGAIVQSQDTGFGANVNAEVTQRSFDGENNSYLNQSQDLHGIATSKAGPIDQQQGSFSSGVNGSVSQDSTGVSKSSNKQRKHWKLNGHTDGTLTQGQFDPFACCTGQFDNPDNEFDIDQDATLDADPGANQIVNGEGNCDTSGNCNVDQKVKTDTDDEHNSCTDESCHIFVSCVEGTCTSGETGTTEFFRIARSVRRP